MSRRLAQILIGDGSVKQSDIEEALQRQVLFGGSLGTNLLEGGSVSERVLLPALGKAHDLPTAGKAEIDAIGPHIPRLFPQVFAESYHLVPYRLEADELGVLVTGDPDSGLLARIHERLALRPVPAVTSEVRLHYAMNHLYGTELLPRIKALLSKLDGTTVVTEPAAGDKPGAVLSWGVGGGRAQGKLAAGGARKKVNLRELLAKLEFATDRDSIVEILMDAVVGIFDYAALFIVQGQVVNGWRGGDHDATSRIARISLPVELPSVFQTIYATGGHYLGPLPSNSVNTKLLGDMGRPAPRAAFVAPLIIGDRLAMLVYADNGPRGISPRRVAAVLLLTQRCSIAFERVIRKRKATAARILDRDATSGEWQEDIPIEFDLADEVTPQPRHEIGEGEFEVIGSPVPAPLPPVNLTADPKPRTVPPKAFSEIDTSPDATRAAFESGIQAHAEDVIEIDEDYVAFADIDDSGDALDGWGDVLLETADALGVQTTITSPAPAAPTQVSVTWDDVIEEALSAAQHVHKPVVGAIEVAGTLVDEAEILFDGLLASDAQVRRDAIERLLQLGSAVDDGIRQRFPGVITIDPLDPEMRIPPFARCSGLTELLQARGSDAATVVLPFLESLNPVARFFAIYYFLAVPYAPALEGLARRLYDTEPRCRHLAADALRSYSHTPGYGRVVESLRAQLKVPVLESRIAAIQLLGQLRDPSSVPELIPLVVAPEPELGRASASALTVVCAQDFGSDVIQWSEWWRRNYNRPRPVWLIQGLRHSNSAIRGISNYELQLLTGMTTHFDPDGPENDREDKARRWENWWLHVTRSSGAGQSAAAAQ